jgi:hypothetical protein
MLFMQGQTPFQNSQHLLPTVYLGQLISQPRMAAEFAPNLDSITLPRRKEDLLRTVPDTQATRKAASGIDPGNT